jgi:hypothetical protein
MQKLMRRSISLMEARAMASENTFMMNRNGYLFLSTDQTPNQLQQGVPHSWGLRDHQSNGSGESGSASYVGNVALSAPDPHCRFLRNPDGMDLLAPQQLAVRASPDTLATNRKRTRAI